MRLAVGLDADARQPDPDPGPAAEPIRVVPRAEVDGLDEALARAQAGDESGFRELWRAVQPPLLRYLRVRTNDGGGEDVAAETWLQVIRDLPRFDGDAQAFRGWVFTIARNRAVDAARARAARPLVLTADPLDSVTDHRGLDEHRGTVESAESVALERLSTRQALRLVAALPADQAEMVALRVIAGLDVATVARIVGRSPGAVRVAVHRGLRTLAGHPDAHDSGDQHPDGRRSGGRPGDPAAEVI